MTAWVTSQSGSWRHFFMTVFSLNANLFQNLKWNTFVFLAASDFGNLFLNSFISCFTIALCSLPFIILRFNLHYGWKSVKWLLKYCWYTKFTMVLREQYTNFTCHLNEIYTYIGFDHKKIIKIDEIEYTNLLCLNLLYTNFTLVLTSCVYKFHICFDLWKLEKNAYKWSHWTEDKFTHIQISPYNTRILYDQCWKFSKPNI